VSNHVKGTHRKERCIPKCHDFSDNADKLNMTQERALTALKANHTLGCIPSNVVSGAREGILPLCSVVVFSLRNVPTSMNKRIYTERKISFYKAF